MTRSQVPKYIKRGKGKVTSGRFKEEETTKQPMNFHHAQARKPRTATNKGRKSMHMAKDNKRK